MKNRTALLALAAFVVLGMPDGMLGPAWPAIRGDLDQPLAALGELTALLSGGFIVSSVLSSRIRLRLRAGGGGGAGAARAAAAVGGGARPGRPEPRQPWRCTRRLPCGRACSSRRLLSGSSRGSSIPASTRMQRSTTGRG